MALSAYDHAEPPGGPYNREYLFHFSEMDPIIHREAAEER